MRTLTLIPALALIATFGTFAFADEEQETARLKARVRILQGRVESLEDLLEDQAAEMAEVRGTLQRVTRYLRQRRAEEDEQGRQTSKKSKKAKSKAKKSKKAKAKKSKKAKAKKSKKAKSKAKKSKKAKAKKSKKAKAKKSKKAKSKSKKARSPQDNFKRSTSRAPRVPQISVALVEHLETLEGKLEGMAILLGGIRDTGTAEDFVEAQAVAQALLNSALQGADQSVSQHKKQIQRHTRELDQRFSKQISALKRKLGKIESAHGVVTTEAAERIRESSGPERAALQSAAQSRSAELRAAGEEAERKVRAIETERAFLHAQVAQGLSAVAKSHKAVHASAAKLEEAISER